MGILHMSLTSAYCTPFCIILGCLPHKGAREMAAYGRLCPVTLCLESALMVNLAENSVRRIWRSSFILLHTVSQPMIPVRPVGPRLLLQRPDTARTFKHFRS